MKFVMLRDRTVASTKGHSVEFKKNVPTFVPPALYDEVMAAGAVPEDEADLKSLIEAADAPPSGVVEPTDPTARKAALFEVYKEMQIANNRGEFTAAGVPHPKALKERLGWLVSAKERDETWAAYLNQDE